MGPRGTDLPCRSVVGALVGLAIGAVLVLAPWFGAVALLVVTRRSLDGRPVVPFAAAALVISAASVASDRWDVAAVAFVLALGLLVAAGQAAVRSLTRAQLERGVDGVLIGLVVGALVSLAEIMGGAALLGSAGEPAVAAADRAAAWWPHANLWGASALAPTTGILAWYLGRRDPWRATLAMLAGLVVVLASGSRAALVALVVGGLAAAWAAWPRHARWGPRALAAAALALALVATVFLLDGRRIERLLGPVGVGTFTAAPVRNLLQSSEDLTDGVWWKPVVVVTPVPTQRGEPAVHALERPAGRWTDRVQQRVHLEPGHVYTWSSEFRWLGEGIDPVPAVIGWSGGPDGVGEVVVRLQRDGSPLAAARGAVALERLLVTPLDQAWQRLEFVVEVTGTSAVALELGIAPRTADDPGALAIEVRRLQFERAAEASPYLATAPPDRTRLVAVSAIESRRQLYPLLVDRVRERPLVGWGVDAYAAAARSLDHDVLRETTHEHSLPLWFALRYGALGVLAWLTVMVGLAGRSPVAWAVVASVMVANLVDLSFLSHAVYVSTAVVAGAARAWTKSASDVAATSRATVVEGRLQ